jgi:DNA (cytosine-5)-methyltransferase 1
MEQAGMRVTREHQGVERLIESELGFAFKQQALGTRTTGGKPGSNTSDAFSKLARIASRNDIAVNRAFGAALVAAGLVDDFAPEADLGSGLKRKTDLLCHATASTVRLELMWRRSTGRAEIANYFLTKLFNYGRAIGFLTADVDVDA